MWEDVRYYDEGVDGVIEVPADWSETWREEGLAGSKISLQAIPEDETARESAREAEGADYTYQDGICEIKNWEIREETNTSKVTFRFQLQGKWKLRFSGEREEEIQPEYPGEGEEVAGETGEAPEKMKKSRARPEKPRGKAKRISAGQEKDREEMKRMPAGQEKDREKMKRIPTGQEKDQEKVKRVRTRPEDPVGVRKFLSRNWR